jgi:hypothetical protein
VAVIVVPVIAAGVVLPITGGLDRFRVPPNVKLPLVVTVPVSVRPLTVPVPPTEVTVPPLDGAVLVIVKLGYVPLVLMPVPPVKTTVWSGAVLVTVTAPVEPETLIPVLAANELTTLVRLAPEPTKLVAVIVVPVMAKGVVPPITMLFIVPGFVGAISTAPVPVGLM